MSFAPGQRVHVSTRDHRGHHRTPGYLKGRVGTIQRCHGSFTNPETRAYGEIGPAGEAPLPRPVRERSHGLGGHFRALVGSGMSLEEAE